MLEEVEAGAQCILSLLNKLKQNERERFQKELIELLLKKFENHWYSENPMRGSAYRCIEGGNNPIDKTIEQAAQKVNIHVQRVLLPKHLILWIDPFEVSYSFRPDLQNQTKVYIYKHKMNPNAKTFQPNVFNASNSPNRNTGNMISKLSHSGNSFNWNTNNGHNQQRFYPQVPSNSPYKKRSSNSVSNIVTNTIPVRSPPDVVPSSPTEIPCAITDTAVDQINIKTIHETSNILDDDDDDDDISLTNITPPSLIDTVTVPDSTALLAGDDTDSNTSTISTLTMTSWEDVLSSSTMLSKTSIAKDMILTNLAYLLTMYLALTDRVNMAYDKDVICTKASYDDNESMLTEFLDNKICSNIYSLVSGILLARIVRETSYGKCETMVVSFVTKKNYNRRSITRSCM